MLSLTFAGSYKQSRTCHCKLEKSFITKLWLNEYQPQNRFYSTNKLHFQHQLLNKKKTAKDSSLKLRQFTNEYVPKNWTHTTPRSLSTLKDVEPISTKIAKENSDEKEYKAILSVALDESNRPITQSLIDILFEYLRKGQPEAAWECYKDITSRHRQQYISREQYKNLIKTFNHVKSSHAHALECVLTLVEDMKKLGYQVGRKEKLVVMRLLGLNGQISAMETVFKDLNKDELLVLTDLAAAQKPYNIMLTSYSEHSNTLGPELTAEKSMDVYADMLEQNIQPSTGSTRLLMESIQLVNSSDEMVEKVWSWLWAKMGMEIGTKVNKLEPSIYDQMALYFASAGRIEYAMEIHDIMVKKELPRSLRTMTALIHKVGRSGDIDKSMNLFNDILIVDNMMPNIVTLNALVDIHAHKKPEPDVAGATRIFNMISEMGLKPDIVTYGTIIDMYAKTGDLVNLKKAFYDMKAAKIEASPYIFSSAIECFMKLDDRKTAIEILNVLLKQAERKAQPAREAYNLIFQRLIEGGHINKALDLLSQMLDKKSYLEARTFTPLLSYFAENGSPENVQKVANMMVEAKIKPGLNAYSCLLQSFARAGDIEGAENLFAVLKQKFRPNLYFYNSMLYLYTNKNEMDKVLEVYRRMSKAGLPINQYTYGLLMNYYARRKDMNAVEALFETMQANNVSPGVVCYTILMQAYFETNRPDDAKKVLKHIIESGMKPSNKTMSIFINGCIQFEDISYAESVLKEAISKINQGQLDSRKLLKDVTPLSDRSYKTMIPQTIEDILERKHKLDENAPVSPYLFTPIIDAYTNAKSLDQAKDIASMMLKFSGNINEPTFVTIMNIFKTENKHETIEALWKGLFEPSPNQTSVDTLDPLLPSIPLPERNDTSASFSSFGFVDIAPNQTSNFAVSIYMDSLSEQGRFDDVDALWNKLELQKFVFDDQNCNRYITSLIKNNQLDEACQAVSRYLFNGTETEAIIKSQRKRDDLFISSDNLLHVRTCRSFAEAFDIPGHDGMGDTRLRMIVTEKVRERLHQITTSS